MKRMRNEERGMKNRKFRVGCATAHQKSCNDFPRSHALRGNAYLRLNGVPRLYTQKAFVCIPTQERGNEKKISEKAA